MHFALPISQGFMDACVLRLLVVVAVASVSKKASVHPKPCGETDTFSGFQAPIHATEALKTSGQRHVYDGTR